MGHDVSSWPIFFRKLTSNYNQLVLISQLPAFLKYAITIEANVVLLKLYSYIPRLK